MFTHRVRLYLAGLVAAVINGAVNAGFLVVIDPEKFNLQSSGGFKNLGLALGVAALVGFFTYMKQHPIPTPDDVDFNAAQAAAVTRLVSGGTGNGTVAAVRNGPVVPVVPDK